MNTLDVSQRCRKFIWGGCGGVVPFRSRRACLRAECATTGNSNDGKKRCDQTVSDLLPDVPPGSFTCQAIWTSWYFNKQTGKCTSVSYSGCSQVGPFLSERECETAGCNKDGEDDVCKLTRADVLPDLPPGTITCQAFWTSWFYNQDTMECESFSYSGCGPVGPFTSATECTDKCAI